MPNYNQKAIEGHVYCWQIQRKPPNFAHSALLKVTITEVWSLEDVKSFYDKIDRGEYTLQDAIKGFLYCLYRQRVPIKAAHAKVYKVLGDDGIKMEDVQEIYQKIEEGYNMETISLEGIMKLMDAKIVNELDLKSRLSLRNTSKALRTLIENGNYKMKSLIIEIGEELIVIENYKEYECAFRKQGNKCAIYENGEYILVKGAFWKRARKALKLFLGVNNYTKIEKLELRAPRFFQPNLTFEDVLESLDKKLKVKMLDFNTPNYNIMHHIADLLDCLDPHELEELTTRCSLPGFFACQIFETEHWKNLKSFSCYQQVFYISLGDAFGHLHYGRFRPLRYPTVDQLTHLKDKLLQNQNFEAMKLYQTLERENIDEFRSHFDGIADFKTSFDVVPATDRKVLSVFIDSIAILFKGPCSECSVSGDTAELRDTASGLLERFHRERNDDSKWYHFYY